MSSDLSTTPNAEFIQTWNEILVPKFRRFRHIIADGFSLHSDEAMKRYPPAMGARVLDVGCGFGETSVQLAQMVGPGGSVLGVDCCDAFVETAREDADRARLTNATFEVVDAQSHAFGESFDMVFSRFGTMFFGNPVAAMRNLRSSLVPGGRLVMVVWRTIDDNTLMSLPKSVALRHLPPPPDQGASCGPGPFSMANGESVREILAAAGFTNVTLDRVDAKVMAGRTIDECIEFQLALGPAGEVVREAGQEGEAKRPIIVGELTTLIAPYMTAGGVVLPTSSWTVSARHPSQASGT